MPQRRRFPANLRRALVALAERQTSISLNAIADRSGQRGRFLTVFGDIFCWRPLISFIIIHSFIYSEWQVQIRQCVSSLTSRSIVNDSTFWVKVYQFKVLYLYRQHFLQASIYSYTDEDLENVPPELGEEKPDANCPVLPCSWYLTSLPHELSWI